MTSGLFYHPECERHNPPEGHPECAARLGVVMDALKGKDFSDLVRFEADQATQDMLLLVHPESHINHVKDNIPPQGIYSLDADTHLSTGSYRSALRAVGAVCGAIDKVMAGEMDNAFCAVRPPGHHAEPDQAMGFCLFNSVAIGALYARKVHFCRRVAIIDFDVHHGNGTQTVVEQHKGLFYGSTHQSPLYPGTGHLQDQGRGIIVNAPLADGSGSHAFRRAYEERILPELEKFKPDFILISAGFDGHAMDPLANLNLNEEDFFWITSRIMDMARSHCHGRLVSSLEGGYNLSVLGESAAAHVSALMR